MAGRRRVACLAMPIVVGLALVGSGCGSEGRAICGRSGAAELCIVGGPSSYKVKGEGFQARSHATLSMGDGGKPLVLDVDSAGRVTTDGAHVGVLGGPDPQVVVVTGTTPTGEQAEFKLTVPAVRP